MSSIEKINAIQYDLAKWGPVAARMMLYENFFSGWASTSTYTGPSGKPIGYHYVTIVGWKGEEWICRNTWGAEWGLLGYFTIQMNCGVELEDQVAAVWPQLPWPSTTSFDVFQGQVLSTSMSTVGLYHTVPSMLLEQQARLQVDPSTGYTAQARLQVEQGLLEGDLSPMVRFLSHLPSPVTFWAMDILELTRLNVSSAFVDEVYESTGVDNVLLALIVVCGALTAWVAYQGNSTKNGK